MALQARDAVMMIVAFLLGLLLISALLSQPQPPPQPQKTETGQQKPVGQKIPVSSISTLRDGKFLLLLQDGTILLCEEKGGALALLDEYSVMRSGGKSFLGTLGTSEDKEPEGKKSDSNGLKEGGAKQ